MEEMRGTSVKSEESKDANEEKYMIPVDDLTLMFATMITKKDEYYNKCGEDKAKYSGDREMYIIMLCHDNDADTLPMRKALVDHLTSKSESFPDDLLGYHEDICSKHPYKDYKIAIERDCGITCRNDKECIEFIKSLPEGLLNNECVSNILDYLSNDDKYLYLDSLLELFKCKDRTDDKGNARKIRMCYDYLSAEFSDDDSEDIED